MSKINDGGSAFPSEQGETQNNEWNQTYQPGMSLRDWFAGQALNAILIQRHGLVGSNCEEQAFRAADRMIEERTKQR